MNDKNHPVWPIIKQVVSAATIITVCSLLYNTGFVPKDTLLVAINAIAILSVDVLRKMFQSNEQ